jgi:hypothetical protein
VQLRRWCRGRCYAVEGSTDGGIDGPPGFDSVRAASSAAKWAGEGKKGRSRGFDRLRRRCAASLYWLCRWRGVLSKDTWGWALDAGRLSSVASPTSACDHRNGR